MIESADLTEPGAPVPPKPGLPDGRPGPEIDPSPPPVELPADTPITVVSSADRVTDNKKRPHRLVAGTAFGNAIEPGNGGRAVVLVLR